ncbi:MAG: hypothetical protein ACYSVY_12990, partial [Planctomycetota bacterium]
MADSFDQFETVLREELSDAVTDLSLSNDDPWWNLIETFQPEPRGGRVLGTATGTSAGDAGWEAN